MSDGVLLTSRDVPLGGVRGITVQRALPQRRIPTVGAWCFLDHFDSGEQMRVLPHPHTGLQTVTWPFEGPIRHRDSLGNDVVLEPGELNLMTSGDGVSHSEFSVEPEGTRLHGVQLWVALPQSRCSGPADFEHVEDLPVVETDGFTATVFVGRWGGHESPARTYTPLVGVDLELDPGRGTLSLDPTFEHAFFVVEGAIDVDGEPTHARELRYLPPGRDRVDVDVRDDAHVILLGGEPFTEDLVMWWNFIGRTHDDVATARAEWEAAADRFGHVDGHDGDRIPAPPMPQVRLTPRRRQG